MNYDSLVHSYDQIDYDSLIHSCGKIDFWCIHADSVLVLHSPACNELGFKTRRLLVTHFMSVPRKWYRRKARRRRTWYISLAREKLNATRIIFLLPRQEEKNDGLTYSTSLRWMGHQFSSPPPRQVNSLSLTCLPGQACISHELMARWLTDWVRISAGIGVCWLMPLALLRIVACSGIQLFGDTRSRQALLVFVELITSRNLALSVWKIDMQACGRT